MNPETTTGVYLFGAMKPRAGFDSMLTMLRVANSAYNAELELRLWKAAALYVSVANGEDLRDEIKHLFNEEERRLYAQFASEIGHQTLNHLRKDAGVAVSKRWRCWSNKGRWRSPFSRFDGTGYLSAGSQTNAKAFAVIRPDEEKKGKRTERHCVCEFRVTAKTKLVVPFVLDRPLPVDADIAQVRFHVGRVGDRWEYSLTFCVRNYQRRQLPVGVGTCSINFGWRTMPNGNVRIATIVGDQGIEFFELPKHMIGARKHAEGLRSLADEVAAKHLGQARFRHRARREALKGKGPHYLGLIQFDPNVHSDREHWARRDRHLYQWENDEHTKVLRQRKYLYRQFARTLLSKYAAVTIETYSLAALAKAATTPELPREKAARHIRQLVAPGFLRAEIKSVFGERCNDLCKAVRTKRCSVCGKKCEFDAAAELEHECEHCGAVWDQDVNNAQNQESDFAAE